METYSHRQCQRQIVEDARRYLFKKCERYLDDLTHQEIVELLDGYEIPPSRAVKIKVLWDTMKNFDWTTCKTKTVTEERPIKLDRFVAMIRQIKSLPPHYRYNDLEDEQNEVIEASQFNESK